MYSNEKIKEILGYIKYAKEFVSEPYDEDLYLKELETITCVQDIKNSSLLKDWESSLIINLEGLKALKDEGEKKKNLKTYLIIHPLFLEREAFIEKELMEFLDNRKDISIKKQTYLFTKELVERMYGGTSWFEPYSKMCLNKNAFDKKSFCYQLVSPNKDCVLDLVEFKNNFREKYPNMKLIENFKNCILPGRIYPFHTPDSIENDNHVKAIESVLVGENV